MASALDDVFAHAGWYRRRGTMQARQLAADTTWESDHGDALVGRRGDWLVTEVGRSWVVADHIFRGSYAAVGEGTYRKTALVRAVRLGEDTVVPTLEGNVTARAGDWLLRGVDEEIWPVRAEVFEETYEPAPDYRRGPR